VSKSASTRALSLYVCVLSLSRRPRALVLSRALSLDSLSHTLSHLLVFLSVSLARSRSLQPPKWGTLGRGLVTATSAARRKDVLGEDPQPSLLKTETAFVRLGSRRFCQRFATQLRAVLTNLWYSHTYSFVTICATATLTVLSSYRAKPCQTYPKDRDGMELGSVTLKRISFFCFPIKHSTHTGGGSG